MQDLMSDKERYKWNYNLCKDEALIIKNLLEYQNNILFHILNWGSLKDLSLKIRIPKEILKLELQTFSFPKKGFIKKVFKAIEVKEEDLISPLLKYLTNKGDLNG